MEMMVHGKLRTITRCYIVFDEIDGSHWYFVYVDYKQGPFSYCSEAYKAFRQPDKALECAARIKNAMTAEGDAENKKLIKKLEDLGLGV